MNGEWRTKRSAQAPAAPLRPSKRPFARPKARVLDMDDFDDWPVREASFPVKLTCSPLDVDSASLTSASSQSIEAPSVAKPMASKPVPFEELVRKYPPLSVKPANEDDGWL